MPRGQYLDVSLSMPTVNRQDISLDLRVAHVTQLHVEVFQSRKCLSSDGRIVANTHHPSRINALVQFGILDRSKRALWC